MALAVVAVLVTVSVLIHARRLRRRLTASVAEAAASRDGFRRLLDGLPDAVFGLDPDGTSETVLTNARTAAAFDLDSENNRLVVPLVRENKVAVVSLQ